MRSGSITTFVVGMVAFTGGLLVGMLVTTIIYRRDIDRVEGLEEELASLRGGLTQNKEYVPSLPAKRSAPAIENAIWKRSPWVKQKTDCEWFKARFDKQSIISWRTFAHPSYGQESYQLRIIVNIDTIPDQPIKRFQGLLKIRGSEGKELHSEMLDHQPDVSFSDHTFYFCEWDYDDGNPQHRELRYSDDLTVEFLVRQVTYADGTTRQFD